MTPIARSLRVLLRAIGVTANHVSKMLVSLYDLLVMLPLGIERMVVAQRSSAGRSVKDNGEDAGANDKDTGRKRRARKREQTGAGEPEPTPTEA